MKSIFTRIGCAALVILTALSVSSCSMADAFKALFEDAVSMTASNSDISFFIIVFLLICQIKYDESIIKNISINVNL